MELLAISLGLPREVRHNGRPVSTGIFKEPVEGAVRVGRLGLEGDVQVDRGNHGGPDKAVYAYTVENYRFWEHEFSTDGFPYGQFGENFTVFGLPDESVHVGDRFRVGSVLVEVTQPRVPCFKLGIRMGDPAFVSRFLRSGRVGFYLRVLEEGEVQTGDTIVRIREHPERLSIRECMLARLKGPQQTDIIHRALRIEALSSVWREDLEQRLTSAQPRRRE